MLCKKNSNSTEIIVLQYPAYTKKDILKIFFEENKKDSKKVWEAINAIINNKKTKKSWQISSYINNVFTTDHKAIANHFNKFFTSKPYKLITKILQTNCAYHDYLKIQMKNPCSCIQWTQSYCWLYCFLVQHDCLYIQQFGFCNSHTTNQTLINILKKFEMLLITTILHAVYFSTSRRLLTLLIMKYWYQN